MEAAQPAPQSATKPPTPVAIAIVVHRRRVLVGQRPEGVSLAGYSEFPGGKIEPSESAEAAAARECHEETGLACIAVRVLCQFRYDYPQTSVDLSFVLCELASAEALLPAAPFRWVEVEILNSEAFPPANRQVIRLLQELFRQP